MFSPFSWPPVICVLSAAITVSGAVPWRWRWTFVFFFFFPFCLKRKPGVDGWTLGANPISVRKKNLMKSLPQKHWFVSPHPPVFHRTKCSLCYLSISFFFPFSSRQIKCTTRHSYLFISVVSLPHFFACRMYTHPPHLPSPSLTLPMASSHVC